MKLTLCLYHALRMAGDLGLYYAFASFFVGCFGGGLALPGLLIPAVCYALSAALREKGSVRLAALAPLAAGLLWPGMTMADRTAYIPAAAYAAYLIWREEYGLSQYHEADVFGILCRSYPIFAVMLGIIVDRTIMLERSLPLAVMCAVLCVALMRTLRHDVRVYARPSFLVRSTAPLALVALCAALLSWRPFVQGMTGAVWTLYLWTLYPLLRGIAWAVSGVLSRAFPVMQWLASLFERSGEVVPESAWETGGAQAAETAASSGGVSPAVWLVLAAAGAALAVWAVLVLLRRMAQPNRNEAEEGGFALPFVRRAYEGPVVGEKPAEKRSAADKVRRQYRKYLRLCAERGTTLRPCDTSRDVMERAAGIRRSSSAAEEELRALYLRARYSGAADKADAARAKELLRQIREENRPA